MPIQIKRHLIILSIVIVISFLLRQWLVPESFGDLGHYRANSLGDNELFEMHYAGQEACTECHEEEYDLKEMDMHFEQKGEKVTVTWTGRRGDEMKAEGTIKGNEIEWSVTRSMRDREFTITYKGTIKGDTMTGTREMGEMGSSEWTAKKKVNTLN